MYLKSPRRSRKQMNWLLKKQSLNQGIFTTDFLIQFLMILTKHPLAWGTPQKCLKQGTHRTPPATVSTEIPGGRFEIAARTAVYCCVLLCTTVYYCVLLYTTVYCCVLLYTTLYYCILLCTAVCYCAPVREIASRQEPLTCRKTSQIQMQWIH